MNNNNFTIPYVKPNIDIEYEKKISEARQNNAKEILKDKGIQKKIANLSERFGYDEELLWKRLNEDELIALFLAKDPGRQTIHQAVAAEFIANLPFVSELIVPPSGGKNALYCIEGKLIRGSEIQDPQVKSIDFYWKYIYRDKQLEFYATHKYTKEEGGAQDNQFNDVREFNRNAMQCLESNIYFFSITDGPYYQHKYTKDTKNRSRLEYYNDNFSGERNRATTSNTLLMDMIPVIENWLKENFLEEDIIEEQKKLEYILSFYI